VVICPRRGALARRPGALRALGDLLLPVPQLATRRHLGRDAHQAAGPGGRERPDHLGRVGRLHGRAGAPARRRRPTKGDLQREPPSTDHNIEPNDHGLGRSRGGLTTKLHLACCGRSRDSPWFCPNDQVIPQGDDRRLRRGHPGDEVRTPDTAAGDRAQLAPPPSGVAAALTRTAADSRTVRLRAWSSAVLAHKDRGQDGRRPSRQHLARTDFWTAACDASGVRPCGPWTSSRRLSVRRHPGDVPDRAVGELFDRRQPARPGNARCR
jgi:hypothetical protein